MRVNRLNSFFLAIIIVMLMFFVTINLHAQNKNRTKPDRGNKQQRGSETFLTNIPSYDGNAILGRPSYHGITISVLVFVDRECVVVYGKTGSGKQLRTPSFFIHKNVPYEVTIEGLDHDAEYWYRVVEKDTDLPIFPSVPEGCFRTARSPGTEFTFVVTADSHLDENVSLEHYASCLNRIKGDHPDFQVDLGDTFMTGKHQSRETALLQYAAQRYYFGLSGNSVPLFLVIGNHDGEEVFRPHATDSDGLAVWSCRMRKLYFPNPEPDAFYTGDTVVQSSAGLLQDYYAWTWGDALFIVLNPYWTSSGTRGGKDSWAMTLGATQYAWLEETLKKSSSRYKFIFIHQLVGGSDNGGRGGTEFAGLYEWGGHENTGSFTFSTHRPGWSMPIHRLLVQYGVTAVFHGHDHFYAHQELDGVIYQLVPQPAQKNSRTHHAEEYGYHDGTLSAGSGYLRVRVEKEQIRVDFISSDNGNVLQSYMNRQ